MEGSATTLYSFWCVKLQDLPYKHLILFASLITNCQYLSSPIAAAAAAAASGSGKQPQHPSYTLNPK
jgi:hypothetical protein